MWLTPGNNTFGVVIGAGIPNRVAGRGVSKMISHLLDVLERALRIMDDNGLGIPAIHLSHAIDALHDMQRQPAEEDGASASVQRGDTASGRKL